MLSVLFSFSSFEYFYVPKILKVFYLRIHLNFILLTVHFFLNNLHKFLLTSIAIATAIMCPAQSALHSGTWAKISVSESGVYKITYEELVKWGFSDIRSIAVYGNGAGEKLLINTSALPDTLHPIAITVVTGNDNTFNSGDYILFYGQSPDTWSYNAANKTFTHSKNRLNDKNFYFITSNAPAKSIQKDATTGSASITSNSYDNLQFYEKDEVSPLATGRNLFESISSDKSIQFTVPHVLESEQASATIAFAARHTAQATVDISINNAQSETMQFSSTTTNKPYARMQVKSFSFYPKEKNTISLKLK